MDKVIKLMLIMIAILVVLMITIPRYVDRKVDISLKVGDAWRGGAISVMEYDVISRYFEHFFTLIREQEYDKAYAMTTLQYRIHVPLEEFEQMILSYPVDSLILKEIVPLTQNLFQVNFTSEEKEYHFLTLFSDGKVEIGLDRFLEEKQYDDVKVKKGKVLYKLKRTENFVDKFIVYLEVDNQRNTDISLQNVILKIEGHREKVATHESFIVPQRKTTELMIEFKTNLEFPSSLQFYSVDENEKQLGNFSIEL